MQKILLVNGHAERCGVYQFGHNLFRVLVNSGEYGYQIHHGRFDNDRNFCEVARDYDGVLVNWHTATMNWMCDPLLQAVRESGKKVLLIPHDENVAFSQVDAVCFIDPTIDEKTLPKGQYVLGRPLLLIPVTPGLNKKFTIGFAGFPFDHKGIEKIYNIAKAEECSVRLHLPTSHYGGDTGYVATLQEKFKDVATEIRTEFMTTPELIQFMAGNNMNIFPYEESRVVNRGISSITDIALASRQPFMISRSNMFRHFAEEDRAKMTIGHVSARECWYSYMQDDYLEKYRQRWSREANINKFRQILWETFNESDSASR